MTNLSQPSTHHNTSWTVLHYAEHIRKNHVMILPQALLARLTALSGISGCPLLKHINPIWFVIRWCAANGSFRCNRSCIGILSVSQFSLHYQRRVEALTLHSHYTYTTPNTAHYVNVAAWGWVKRAMFQSISQLSNNCGSLSNQSGLLIMWQM